MLLPPLSDGDRVHVPLPQVGGDEEVVWPSNTLPRRRGTAVILFGSTSKELVGETASIF